MTDHERGIEAAMSAYYKAIEGGYQRTHKQIEEIISAYLATTSKPVAEAVKVKPLGWNPYRAETAFGYYNIDDQTDRSEEELQGRLPFLLSGSRFDLSRYASLADARAAAQADYEQRVMSALSTPPQPEAQGDPITLTYTNWRGETAERTILPKRVWFGSTDWHPEPQWLLTAIDCDKQAERDFALKDFGPTALRKRCTELEAALGAILANHETVGAGASIFQCTTAEVKAARAALTQEETKP